MRDKNSWKTYNHHILIWLVTAIDGLQSWSRIEDSTKLVAQRKVQELRCTCMSVHVLTRQAVATHPHRREGKMNKAKRNGKPFTVWFNEDLSNALASASEQRKVDKSEIVRVAVKRLLNDLETGQLELPLGIR
jgi:hypothetical protein